MYHTIFSNEEIVYRGDIDGEPRNLKRIFSELCLGRYCPRSIDVTAYEVDFAIKKALREAYPYPIIDWDNDELVLDNYEIRQLKKFLEKVNFDSLNDQYSDLFIAYEGGQVYCGGTEILESTYQKYTYLQALVLPNEPVIECTYGSPLDKKIKEFNEKTDFFFYRVIDVIVRFAEEHPDLEKYTFCSQ